MNVEPIEAEYLTRLKQRAENEIETYTYDFPDNAIGKPWSDAAIKDALARFRASLIEPYWVDVEIRDTFEQVRMAAAPRRRCAAVADDGNGVLLLFDPLENSFVLAEHETTGLATFGVRGDAVGCFLAR